MNTQEKQAWFTLLVVVVTLLVYGILYAITKSPAASSASFSLCALLAAQVLIGRKERKNGKIVADERDIQINLTAGTIASGVFWVIFVAAAMAPFFILGPDATMQIKTTTLTMVIYPAFSLVCMVRSLVMIALYRKGQHE